MEGGLPLPALIAEMRDGTGPSPTNIGVLNRYLAKHEGITECAWILDRAPTRRWNDGFSIGQVQIYVHQSMEFRVKLDDLRGLLEEHQIPCLTATRSPLV